MSCVLGVDAEEEQPVFEALNSGYTHATEPVDIDGTLAYLAQKPDPNSFNRSYLYKRIIVFGEKEVELPGSGNTVWHLRNINGKLSYIVHAESNLPEYIQYGDQKIILDKGYFSIDEGEIAFWDNDIIYEAQSYANNSHVLFKGKEPIARRVIFWKVLEGGIVYVLDQGDDQAVLIYHGQKIAIGDPRYLTDVVSIKGKLAVEFFYPIECAPSLPGSERYCPPGSGKILYDGKQVSWPLYTSLSNPVEYKGQLTVIARSGAEGYGHYCIVSDGKPITPEYKFIQVLKIIDGKLFFIAWANAPARKLAIFRDGQQIGDSHDFHPENYIASESIAVLRDKPVFRIIHGSTFTIIYNGKVTTPDYSCTDTSCGNMLVSNGKLVFTTSTGIMVER